MAPTEKIFKETKLFSLPQIYKYSTCILIQKILTKDIHTQIEFEKNINIQKTITRQLNNIYIKKPRTNYGIKNIMFEGAQLYNKLPNKIKQAKSLNNFKKLLKIQIFNDFS